MTTDNKIDLILQQLSTMQSDIGDLKSDIGDLKSDMAGVKSDITGIKSVMVTKDYLEERLNELENNVLEEVDTVQEKSNAHYQDVSEQIKQLSGAIHTNRLENSIVHLLSDSVSNLRSEVETLKTRLDKVS